MSASQSGGGIGVLSVTFSLPRDYQNPLPTNSLPGDHLLLCIDGLEHKQRTAQVPTTLLRNPLIQTLCLRPAFPLRGNSKCRADITLTRRGHPNQQGSRTYGGNNVRGTISQENQPQVRTVFLHRPTQRSLCITREMIRFIDNDHLEPLLRGQIHLLRLGNLLQQFLDHDPVIVPDVRGCDFEVVDGGHDVEFELAVAGRLEDTGIDFDLFHSRPVQFFQCRDDACFLACS